MNTDKNTQKGARVPQEADAEAALALNLGTGDAFLVVWRAVQEALEAGTGRGETVSLAATDLSLWQAALKPFDPLQVGLTGRPVRESVLLKWAGQLWDDAHLEQ